MPRLPRVYLENALYYVTNRGDHNQDIFRDEGDYKMFLELLKKYKEQYGFKLFAYVLLPNHFHLLLELPGQKDEISKRGLSEIMHDQNSSYTKYFNGKYNRNGHLFRERFKAALVEKEPYLLKLTAYIHLNPKVLNLVSQVGDYPYSSYLLYMDKEVPFAGLMKEEKVEVLRLLSGQNYDQFLDNVSKELELNLHKYLHKKRVLGSQDFQEKVKEVLEYSIKEEKDKEESRGLGLGAKIGLITFLFILVGSGLTYVLKLTLKEKKEKPLVFPSQIKTEELELEGTEWQIRLIPAGGEKEEVDFISFNQGKFISGKLNSSGYPVSNYTLTIEDGKRKVFETMQTGPQGTASWRGEIEEGKMRGILSLREKDKETQDFSFVSIGYRRKR